MAVAMLASLLAAIAVGLGQLGCSMVVAGGGFVGGAVSVGALGLQAKARSSLAIRGAQVLFLIGAALCGLTLEVNLVVPADAADVMGGLVVGGFVRAAGGLGVGVSPSHRARWLAVGFTLSWPLAVCLTVTVLLVAICNIHPAGWSGSGIFLSHSPTLSGTSHSTVDG